jgi:flagellar biosynthesis/type III secretory pathway protein FliH
MGSTRHTLNLGAPIAGAELSSRDVATVLAERTERRIHEAHEEGFAAGHSQALAQFGPMFDSAIDHLDKFREHSTNEMARDAVELAVEIARQLVQCRVSAGDYDLERMVRGALDAADVGRGNCSVHVAADDYERLEHIVFRGGTKIEVDTEMNPGDLHVATPRGLLVRELAPTLDAIREQLLEDIA